MKWFNKTWIFLSFVTLGLSHLDAKSLEFLLDHTTQENFNVEASIREQNQENLLDASSIYCQQLKIENLGDQPLQNCLPFVNQAPTLTLEQLAAQVAEEKYPLMALYHLWNQAVVKQEMEDNLDCHPLDLLNLKGFCPSSTFDMQFVKLCQALGVETRLVNGRGQAFFDFCCRDEEWNFLDVHHQHVYLGLDNQTLVSSDAVMDDPFLALRTKHQRRDQFLDFKQAWQQLARLEILEPCSAETITLPLKDLETRPQGFTLYPQETLLFETPAVCEELAGYERHVQHTLNLAARATTQSWTYSSPFPIQKIENRSTSILQLLDQDTDLQPGELLTLTEPVFQLNLNFVNQPEGQLIVSGTYAWSLFPTLKQGENHLNLGSEVNPSIVRLCFEVNETLEESEPLPTVRLVNSQLEFDYCSPQFAFGYAPRIPETIWWQISHEADFALVPANFDQIESATDYITLPAISETFLNPDETYYFRVKGNYQGQWSEWSEVYPFVVHKPRALENVEFDQLSDNCYELNWERWAEDTDSPVEYLVFGSNSFDFIPSIYSDKQINAMMDGVVVEEETNDNLVALTTASKLRVKGTLAYYRIIARQRGQLSNPSPLIHVYDSDLVQPRNVLQVVKDEYQRQIAKRTLFPASFPWSEVALPHAVLPPDYSNNMITVQSLLRSARQLDKKKYEYVSPQVSEEIWEAVRPYLLPSNHPAWPKLNRIFCACRVIQTPEAFRDAGFKRWNPGRWSRVLASSHPELKEYFIKAYADTELGIMYDWKKWIHRIEGAKTIQECINRNNLQKNFKVPRKYIYPLPAEPSPPNSSRYLRKNFILVADNMRIQEHSKNEKMYKKDMSQQMMEGLYIVLQECGLYDSVYCFNIPFCKDGRIAVIDTEYHHKWPVPFERLTHCFSKDMRNYWQKITFNGGRIPNGENQPNPPRQDRRDVQQMNK